MGMTADQHDFMLFDPLVVHLFDLVTLQTALCRAGCVAETQDVVHDAPEVPDEETGNPPDLVVGEVALMTVDYEYFLAGLAVLHDQGFMDVDPGE